MIEQSIKNSFERAFSFPPSFIVRAPGRINLIGEHTDYNNGFVFPAAIDRYVYLAFAANMLTSNSRVIAKDLEDSATIHLSSLEKTDVQWKNFLLGILLQFKQQGHELKDFNCLIQSTVPIGAGMSSSSALECGFAKGIAHLNKIELSNWEIVDISHKSNHEFLGIKGGIMDQFSSLFGRKEFGMILDCQDRSHSYVPINLQDYQWVLINSNIKHDHLVSGYGDRVKECREAESNLEISTLRSMTTQHLKSYKSKLSEIHYKRSKFVLEENARVQTFAEALKSQKVEKLGDLLYKSHNGLKNEYEVSCEELDFLVELSKKEEGVLGARMMGGGFGGCTINLIKKKSIEETITNIKDAYLSKYTIRPEHYLVEIVDGVKIL